MKGVREAWTDERLDDLNRRVDGGFTEMRTEFRAVRREMMAGLVAMVVGFGTTIAVILAHG